MHVVKAFLLPVLVLPVLLGAACNGDDGSDDLSNDGSDDGAEEEIGEAESSYLLATETLTEGLYTADCELTTQLLADYAVYSEAMTNARLRELASSRFEPMLDYMSRKLCNELGISGDVEAYERDAIADSPAGEFLSGTPLLQAIVDQTSDLDALLDAENEERSADGLDPIIVADYYNSVVGGTSTIVLFPGWPGRPGLDQWLQVQRTVRQMFFVTLEPRDDGTYASFVHSRALRASSGTWTIGTAATETTSTCLLCHYSGKPLRMRALDDAEEAAKVDTLVGYLAEYPPTTNHPEYNPFPDAIGLGTGGTMTVDEASAYAGRSLTDEELATLNRNTACDSCHNGTIQNPLIPPFGETVEMLMADGFMPPGAGVVVDDDRAEAIAVMNAAYQVKLRRYFVGE